MISSSKQKGLDTGIKRHEKVLFTEKQDEEREREIEIEMYWKKKIVYLEKRKEHGK
jgi:hypothetical protein